MTIYSGIFLIIIGFVGCIFYCKYNKPINSSSEISGKVVKSIKNENGYGYICTIKYFIDNVPHILEKQVGEPLAEGTNVPVEMNASIESNIKSSLIKLFLLSFGCIFLGLIFIAFNIFFK